MFTLKISEIEINPKLTIDNLIEDENELTVLRKACALIEEKFPGVYANPVTLERKINEFIRDENGLTRKEKSNQTTDASLKTAKEITQKNEEQYSKLMEIFLSKTSELRSKRSEEIMAISSLHRGNAHMTPQEIEEVELQKDEINFKYLKLEKEIENEHRANKDKIRSATFGAYGIK